MFINRSRKHTTGSIMLMTSLAFALVLLMEPAALVEAQEAGNRVRSHKAMETFGSSSVVQQPRSATNEQLLQDEDEDQDMVDGSSVESSEDGISGRNSGSGGSSEDARGTTDVSSEQQDVTTPGSVGYVATTPKILKSAKVLSRYEQGLEDYEEAAARVEQEDNQQREQQQQQQQQQSPLGGLMNPILSTLFNVVTTALSSKRSIEVAGPNPAMIFGAWNNLQKALDDGRASARANNDAEESTSSGDGSGNDADNQNGNLTAVVTAAESARYIKGDPLNGYYDFVISEGSYKFWAVFQVATAVLIIYSTFAAIYYSKVSPLTSDYDYIDYLNGGRSFAGSRSLDGGAAARRSYSSNMWDGLLEKPWFNVATNSFAFVMNAIENAPK